MIIANRIKFMTGAKLYYLSLEVNKSLLNSIVDVQLNETDIKSLDGGSYACLFHEPSHPIPPLLARAKDCDFVSLRVNKECVLKIISKISLTMLPPLNNII